MKNECRFLSRSDFLTSGVTTVTNAPARRRLRFIRLHFKLVCRNGNGNVRNNELCVLEDTRSIEYRVDCLCVLLKTHGDSYHNRFS